jgi:hypothetical protein
MISKHISFDEATKSNTAIRHGIDNTPNAEQLKNMKTVAEACFEPLRAWYGKPIKINSFFRCEALNTLVKGSKTSDHMKGKSIDIDAGSVEENKKIFDWCKANLKYDQLINEYNFSWVHISFNLGNNRNQTLIVK